MRPGSRPWPRWWLWSGLGLMAGAAVFFFGPWLMVYGPRKLAGFVYRELQYQVVLSGLRGTGLNRLPELLEYVYGQARNINPGDGDPLATMLIPGGGYCDHKAFLLANLCARLGLGARLVRVQHHVVTEYRWRGRWGVADPLYGWFFLICRRGACRPASFGDMRAQGQKAKKTGRLPGELASNASRPWLIRGDFRYLNKFQIPGPPGTMADSRTYFQGFRRPLYHWIRLLYRLTGGAYARWVLRTTISRAAVVFDYAPVRGTPRRLLIKARLWHLFRDYRRAERAYEKYLHRRGPDRLGWWWGGTAAPPGLVDSELLFYLAQLSREVGRPLSPPLEARLRVTPIFYRYPLTRTLHQRHRRRDYGPLLPRLTLPRGGSR